MADPNTPAEWLRRLRCGSRPALPSGMHDALPRKTMLEIAAGYERLARYAGSAPGTGGGQSANRRCRSRRSHSPTSIVGSERGLLAVDQRPRPGGEFDTSRTQASGGQAMETPVEDFLAVNGPGPDARGFAANARQQRGANRNCGLLISPFIRQNGLDIEQRQPMRLTERVATGDVG